MARTRNRPSLEQRSAGRPGADSAVLAEVWEVAAAAAAEAPAAVVTKERRFMAWLGGKLLSILTWANDPARPGR